MTSVRLGSLQGKTVLWILVHHTCFVPFYLLTRVSVIYLKQVCFLLLLLCLVSVLLLPTLHCLQECIYFSKYLLSSVLGTVGIMGWLRQPRGHLRVRAVRCGDHVQKGTLCCPSIAEEEPARDKQKENKEMATEARRRQSFKQDIHCVNPLETTVLDLKIPRLLLVVCREAVSWSAWLGYIRLGGRAHVW